MKNKTYTTSTRKESKQDLRLIHFQGDLSVKNADEICQKMRSYRYDTGNVRLCLDHVVNIDITFIQLVFALRDQLKEAGILLELESNLPDDLGSIVASAGFGDLAQRN